MQLWNLQAGDAAYRTKVEGLQMTGGRFSAKKTGSVHMRIILNIHEYRFISSFFSVEKCCIMLRRLV